MNIKFMNILAVFIAVMPGAVLAANPACEEIQRSCGEAGFTRDLPLGKDLITRCYQPILQGQNIPNVKVDPDLVKKCNEQQDQKPKERKKRRRF